MANPEHMEILEQGVNAWNTWRKRHGTLAPDLGEANLSGKTLCGIDFRGAQLWRADLSRADLSQANLSGAGLRLAVLSHACLRKANLRASVFIAADLSNADLEGAHVWRTVFVNAILTGARGLDALKHHGHSYLDRHTMARSWPLPGAFLRGCGLCDWEIEAARLYQQALSSKELWRIGAAIVDAYRSDSENK